jgi:ParB-like chromosome segregation protein Spo0J
MPSTEERLSEIERLIAELHKDQQELARRDHLHDEHITIMLGQIVTLVPEVRRLHERLDTLDEGLNEQSRELASHTVLLNEQSHELASHTVLLNQHSRELASHTVLLNQHTELLNQHTDLLQQILAKLP